MSAGRGPTLAGELRVLAADLAGRAGRLIHDRRLGGAGTVATKSSATDLVTEHDKASEALIVGELRTRRPGDAIVGEEGASHQGTSGISWLIDPIDGTTNFFYGLGGYAVSVAATDDSGTLAGAVFLPSADEMYSAAAGEGATLNGTPIGCSSNADLATTLLATGFSYHADLRRRQMQRMHYLIGEIRDIRRFGAAAADLCFVAAGRVDAYFEEHLAPWDLAAGELIAREAGCRTGDLDGAAVRPEQALVANPALFESLRMLIGRADASATAASGNGAGSGFGAG